MDTKFTALSLVVLVVLTSGCIGGNGGNEGQETEKSVEIRSLSVNPTQIYEGTPVNAKMEIKNSGQIDATIDVGDKGDNILTDRCTDVFEMSEEEFSVTPSEFRENRNIYHLEPDQRLTMQWRLNQIGEVPLYGKRCSLKFRVPFNYSVSAYKQVQVKSDRSIEGSSLNWESSSGPLTLAIQTIGGTGSEGQDTFVKGEDRMITALVQFQNDAKEDFNKGVTDIQEETLWIAMADGSGNLIFNDTFETGNEIECPSSGDRTSTCYRTGDKVNRWVPAPNSPAGSTYCNLNNDQPIRVSEGASRVMICDVPLEEVSPEGDTSGPIAEVVEFRSSVDYTYIKDAGTTTVNIECKRC